MIIFPTLGYPKTLSSIVSMFMTLARVLSVNNNTQKNAGREKVYVYQGQLAIFPLPVFLAKASYPDFCAPLFFLHLSQGFLFLFFAVAPSLISMSFLCHMGTRNSGHFFRTPARLEKLLLEIVAVQRDSESRDMTTAEQWTKKFFSFAFPSLSEWKIRSFCSHFRVSLSHYFPLFHFLFPGGT